MTATELKKWLGTEPSRSVGGGGGDGESTDTPWRYSLMNWGHDPLK
jgi:hypothetical protein